MMNYSGAIKMGDNCKPGNDGVFGSEQAIF
jgi:hypothetical protein